jgi:Putative zinc-finger
MECPENEILFRFVDGDPTSTNRAVERHIEQCGRCQQEIDSIRSLDESVREILRADPLVFVTGDECPDRMLLAAYLDGKLSTAERDSMERHLSCCDVCLDEIVAAAERFDLLSKNRQSLPDFLLEKAVDLGKPPTLPETETGFNIVLRMRRKAVELVKGWDDWAELLPDRAVAVRGRRAGSRQGGVLFEKEIGSYKIELNIEQIESMRCRIWITVNEKHGESAVEKDVRVSLSAGKDELKPKLLKRQGHAVFAVFNGSAPGEYCVAVSDRQGSVGTIRLKITAEP